MKSRGDGPASTATSGGRLYLARISAHLDWLPWIQLRRMFCGWNFGSDPGARWSRSSMVQRPLATMCASVSPVPANVPSGVSGISVQGEGCVDVWLLRGDEAGIAVNRRECCR